ncbi:type IV toxin-antitoxin system AbiEi family antitoxin domain-containing protein [Nocardioides limicola]|uniref:type IV toxin-antitoxin system AbiEi family antitoxin domain-containing protein n=1 Tax=Nocardioides limicola TaxID=2803368 RepID=UPI00193BC50C|nr:type IV toxin-antitoxin system AbiEi family antitoxin domain-containing protein [Nocardioides sp. DJM-14]
MTRDISELLVDQSGVVSRRQAQAVGLADHEIRRLVRRHAWTPVHPGVYADHTGPLTWVQRAWAAVLVAGPGAALAGRSALRAIEGPGSALARRDPDPIVVAVPSARTPVAPAGVELRRVTKLGAQVQWHRAPPRQRLEHAAIWVAAEAATDLEALAVIAGLVQTRRTTAQRLHACLGERQRTRRGVWLAAVLDDIAEGACSMLEHGYLTRVERAHGLPSAVRQVRAQATLGMTYRDASYGDLVVELDGRLFHDTARQRDRDLDRDLDAAVEGLRTVRIGYGQVFDRACVTAARIAVLLHRRGWAGRPTPCGPTCAVSLAA